MKKLVLIIGLAVLTWLPLEAQTYKISDAFGYEGNYFATTLDGKLLKLEETGENKIFYQFDAATVRNRKWIVSPSGKYVLSLLGGSNQIVTIINTVDGSSREVSLAKAVSSDYINCSENANYIFTYYSIIDLKTGLELPIEAYAQIEYISDVEGYFIDLEIESGMRRPVYRSLKTGAVIHRLESKYQYHRHFEGSKMFVYTNVPSKYNVFDYKTKKVIPIPYEAKYLAKSMAVGNIAFIDLETRAIKWDMIKGTFSPVDQFPEFMKDYVSSVGNNKALNYSYADFEVFLYDVTTMDIIQQWALSK